MIEFIAMLISVLVAVGAMIFGIEQTRRKSGGVPRPEHSGSGRVVSEPVCPVCKGVGTMWVSESGHSWSEVCKGCMGEGKCWCAMCGTFGDHRSGGCPELKNGQGHRPDDETT
jgi:DnaJ-class molecular chaperone